MTNTPVSPRLKDRTGHVYGRLTVVAYAGQQGRRSMWRCRCQCGGEAVVMGDNLNSGRTTSCGCWHREVLKTHDRTHGLASHPLYDVWCRMISRCHDSDDASYANYGQRGITVCTEWRESPEAFIAHVETLTPAYAPGLQIDRINNEGNYEPGNVRWATRSQNQRNTRRNRWIEYRGVRLAMADWADLLGLKYGTLNSRVHSGWAPERALTQGVDPGRLERVIAERTAPPTP